MSNSMMICEQIAARFNPHINLKIREPRLPQESTIKLVLESISFEPQEMEKFSTDEYTTTYDFTLYGNLFRSTTKEFVAETIELNTSVD